MYKETIKYSIDGQQFIGELRAPDDKQAKRPGILIAHAWMGRDTFAIEKAEALARLGYVAFAADLYGEAAVTTDSKHATELMMPLFLNRELLQKRIRAAYETLKKHRFVEPAKIGGIGFCFGGLTIIELLRSGAEVKGVVSFHAVLANQREGKKAKTVPIQTDIKGSLLMLHGYEDPLVSEDDIRNIQKELSDAHVDWQMNIYSHTAHAFTNPQVHDHQSGLVYNLKSSNRAWGAMRHFFEEVFR